MKNTSKPNTVCLNSLRFFAACIIAFFWHYQHFEPVNGSPFSSAFYFSYSRGWLVVELFFMLSGFGMMIGYGDKIINHIVSFPSYIRKRLNKIYPLFFLSLILVIILQLAYKLQTGTTFTFENFDLWHFFLNLVLCHGGLFVTDFSFNAPSWSISTCFVLYSAFYAVFYCSKTKQAAVYKFGCLGLLGFLVLNIGWDYPILNSLTARGFFSFSIGIILAISTSMNKNKTLVAQCV